MPDSYSVSKTDGIAPDPCVHFGFKLTQLCPIVSIWSKIDGVMPDYYFCNKSKTEPVMPEPYQQLLFPLLAPPSKGSMAPRNSRGHRAVNIAQPYGWEYSTTEAGSTSTSTTSSSASAALAAAAAASVGVEEASSVGGVGTKGDNRRSGSWGGGNAMDREFHRILKAGVDVFKHSCEFLSCFFEHVKKNVLLNSV